MNCIADKAEYSYIFLTLTAKNVKGKDLSQELDKYFAAFKKLTKCKEYKALAHGHFRCLEVTRNWIKDEYHPHFHVIIAVDKGYFVDSRKYLSNEKWTSLWKHCMAIDYAPIVDIRKIKPPGDADNTGEPFSIRYAKAVAEVAKYTVKVDDIILETGKKYREKDVEDAIRSFGEEKRERLTDETVKVLDLALKNRRLVAFGGELKKVHKELSLDDVVEGDLLDADNDEVRSDLQEILIKYRWVVGLSDYFRVKDIGELVDEDDAQI
jgi:plasmid rolling circle replication initiator protein Rep